MSIFDKWNESVSDEFVNEVNGLDKGEGSGFPEVPRGDYEVKIVKMELKESKSGDPMMFIQFKILYGQYKNSMLFMNQVITSPFQIHMANDFLRSLDSGVDIVFRDYSQYNDLLLDVSEEIEKQGLEFALSYKDNDKGYPVYKVTEIFERG